jgi:ssDNA-binding replication factor A large subunit
MTPPEEPEVPREVRLKDLRARPEPIVIMARVVRAERRELPRSDDGRVRTLLSGLLTDGTATVRFTWWDPPTEAIEPGDVLRAGPVQLREYRRRIEVTFTRRTHVEPVSALELELPPLRATAPRRVADLLDGEEELRVDVLVESIRSRVVQVRGIDKTVFHGVVRDASGTLPFVAWTDLHLTEGMAVRIGGAYARSFRGQLELVLDERVRLEPFEETVARVPSNPHLGPAP